MEIVMLIVVGAIVGFIGSLLAGKDVSLLGMIVLGIVGSAIGFAIWRSVGGDAAWVGWALSVVIAAVLVSLFSGMRARRV